MRMIAKQIRYDDRIEGAYVKEYIHILDGNPEDDPRVVLLRLTRSVGETCEPVTTTMWFAGDAEVEVEQSPYRHYEDDNVDSNLRDHSR
jgi:hypothetical protein